LPVTASGGQAELVLDCRNLHGEGVLWNALDQRLWWTDIHGKALWAYDPTGNVTRIDDQESARNRSTGFQSNRYRGGGFSNQASRAKDSTAFRDTEGRYRYRPITTREVKRHRPLMPRKIVGEMVVIDVQARTATAIITRVASEVHTGDWVEIQ